MGEIVVQCEVENTVDRANADRGLVAESRIRHASIEGVVDTGAVMLMLPEDLVERLGLAAGQTVIVSYVDERSEERPVAGPVTVKIGDRMTQTQCVIGPPRCEVLIGQLVLEAMDMVADCTNRTLTPRNPGYPNLKMKVAGFTGHSPLTLAEGQVWDAGIRPRRPTGRRCPVSARTRPSPRIRGTSTAWSHRR